MLLCSEYAAAKHLPGKQAKLFPPFAAPRIIQRVRSEEKPIGYRILEDSKKRGSRNPSSDTHSAGGS